MHTAIVHVYVLVVGLEGCEEEGPAPSKVWQELAHFARHNRTTECYGTPCVSQPTPTTAADIITSAFRLHHRYLISLPISRQHHPTHLSPNRIRSIAAMERGLDAILNDDRVSRFMARQIATE